MRKIRIAEDVKTDKRLGRHINHDPRSRAYAFKAGTYNTIRHERWSAVLDQGDLGSCTGNAGTGALGTAPFPNPPTVTLDENFAVTLYGEATALDNYPGTYPPTDTGSDGLSVAKALQKRGLISGYQHAFTLDAALTALQSYALITGVNWYSSFDEPDVNGLVKIASNAYVRGGHEFEVIGCDVDKRQLECVNSWGSSWGKNGHFFIGFDDFTRLMKEDGDVTVLLPPTVPAPTPTPVPDPTPIPTPTPVADYTDHELWAATEKWANARHTGCNKKAATAVKAWAKKKGLT